MESILGKKLLFLGGTPAIRKVVEKAKSMGIFTIVIDYYANDDYLHSPAKRIADESYQISTFDIEGVIRCCRSKRIDGIFCCYSDSLLPVCLQICEKLKLPFYATEEQIRLSVDKAFFKQMCREYGVPVPADYRICSGYTDKDILKIQFPVIVKPVDNSGGRGVKICRDCNALQSAFENAMQSSPSKTVLVEEYISGDEVTAVYTMKNGEVSLSCFRDRYLSEDHPDITAQFDVSLIPSRYQRLFYETANPKLIEMFKGLGARDGNVFVQGIAANDNIRVFECGYRMNALLDYENIRHENGIDYLEMMICHALTGTMGAYDLSLDNADFKHPSAIFDINLHGGIIGGIEGIERVSEIPGVLSCVQLRSVGDTVIENNDLRQTVLRVSLTGGCLEELCSTIHSIQSLVKVTDTTGRDMLYKPFDTDRFWADSCAPR